MKCCSQFLILGKSNHRPLLVIGPLHGKESIPSLELQFTILRFEEFAHRSGRWNVRVSLILCFGSEIFSKSQNMFSKRSNSMLLKAIFPVLLTLPSMTSISTGFSSQRKRRAKLRASALRKTLSLSLP